MEREKQEERQEYLDERKSLIEAEKLVSASFDRAILSLSGGALALSILFIKQVATDPTVDSRPFLILSWFFFGLAIVIMLASMLSSQSALRRQRDIIGQSHRIGRNAEGHTDRNNKNTPAMWTKWLNLVSILTFVFGVICLSVFSALNLF